MKTAAHPHCTIGIVLGLLMLGPVRAQAPAATVAPAPAPAAAASASKAARKPPAPSAACSVAEFRTLALDTHAPREREALATQWLLKNGPTCSEDQVLMIRANRALWLGTSDTVAVMGLVDRLVEARQAGRPDMLQSLYAPPQPERSGTVDSLRANGGMRPVVPPPAPIPQLMLGGQDQPPGMPGMPMAPPGPPGMPAQPGGAAPSARRAPAG